MNRAEAVLPSKRVCEDFYLTYELKGAQKAVNLLTQYYKIRRTKIVVDGRRVGNIDEALCDHDTYTAFLRTLLTGE